MTRWVYGKILDIFFIIIIIVTSVWLERLDTFTSISSSMHTFTYSLNQVKRIWPNQTKTLPTNTHTLDSKTIGMLFANPNNRPKNRIQLFGCFGVVQIMRDDVKGLRSLLSLFLYVYGCRTCIDDLSKLVSKFRFRMENVLACKRPEQPNTIHQTLKYAQLFWIRFRFVFISLFCVRITIYLSTTTTETKATAMQICILKRWHCSRI